MNRTEQRENILSILAKILITALLMALAIVIANHTGPQIGAPEGVSLDERTESINSAE